MNIDRLYQIASWAVIIVALLFAVGSVAPRVPAWVNILGFVVVAALSAAALVLGNRSGAQRDAEIARLQPRHFHAQQRVALEAALPRPSGLVSFMTPLMDGEARDFANEMADAFRHAGWTVVAVAGNHLADMPGRVTVAFTSGDSRLAEAALGVERALRAASLQIGGEITPGMLPGALGNGVVYIIVGRQARGR